MGERTAHEPGTFSWADLSTTDADGARSFYTALFGWEPEDNPVPGGSVYTLLRKRGRTAAALYEGRPDQPVAWLSYVTVASADDAAAAVRDAGGAVEAEPFDVMEVGRMAVVRDPTGAFFALWEPRASVGAEVVNEPGALTLNQLNTSDPERAQRFYADAFGWSFEAVSSDQPYWGIYTGGRLNGGMMPLPEPGVPSHWLVYFGSEGVDSDAGRIEQLGGTVMLPPMAIESGRILVAQDPQGAVFALFSGRFDD